MLTLAKNCHCTTWRRVKIAQGKRFQHLQAFYPRAIPWLSLGDPISKMVLLHSDDMLLQSLTSSLSPSTLPKGSSAGCSGVCFVSQTSTSAATSVGNWFCNAISQLHLLLDCNPSWPYSFSSLLCKSFLTLNLAAWPLNCFTFVGFRTDYI